MPYVDKDFLLKGATARALYHEVACQQPIIDYHCHLSPKEIYENKPYANVGEMMLGGDHYKWRLMRAAGIPERLITGDGDYEDKFAAYASALEGAAGNPLAHWTALEMQRVFGIQTPLTGQSAPALWEQANAQLDDDALRPRGLIQRFHVKLLCTTDDPCDDLAYHALLLKEEELPFRALPAFRPDRLLQIEAADFGAYIARLGEAATTPIRTLDALLTACNSRLDFFASMGCCMADHGIGALHYEATNIDTARRIFRDALASRQICARDAARYRSFLLVWLGAQYAARGWAQQYHLSAMRNNNARMFSAVGPDAGFDTIGEGHIAHALSRLLDAQCEKGALPRTVLYSLNPSHDAVLASLAGAFSQEGTRSYVQWGAPWWFNDHRDGIQAHLRTLGNMGMVGNFIGMLTDSRSFTSYTRHEYFRRALCNVVGGWVESGEIPPDLDAVSALIENICFGNAQSYFSLDV